MFHGSEPRWLVAALLILVSGCTQEMANQPRAEPLESSAFFADGMASRPLVPGTVARGSLISDPAVATGRLDGELVSDNPLDVDVDLIQRGQERFSIFCAHCHGSAGYGDGMVVQRGFPQPPSFHIDRLRDVADGHLFEVITDGPGRMPALGKRIPVHDRWAIVSYVRALQLSQHISADQLAPADLEALQSSDN